MNRKRKLAVAAATAMVGLGASVVVPVATASASASPNLVACFYRFNNNGVFIRATPDGLPINGEGFAGQAFNSIPSQRLSEFGLLWVHGTDEATGKSGWSAAEFLDVLSCHNFG